MVFDATDIIAIILLISAIYGLLKSGKRKIIRWISTASLILAIIIISIIIIISLDIGIYGFFAALITVFLISAYIIHYYFTGKGGEFEKKQIGTFTLKTINKLKNMRLNPLFPIVVGIIFIIFAYFSVRYRCPLLCDYKLYTLECLFCQSGFFGFVIFLPLGIFFLSIGYIWQRNKDKI